ncbi:MAG: glycosyltransferase WbuB [Armatimonadetes bacterium RBG_16_58_9]|nr:MAG: glycosyltransferase WbuB [Armatimonadetes bacterium RBG_16_58_9]
MTVGQAKGSVLIIVENLSLPFDRRVWAESLALVEAGYKVSVICPMRPGESRHEILENVSIYRYGSPREAKGALGYLWEYAYSLVAALLLSLKVRRREGFDVIQACNPPDVLFVIARFHKLFGRKKFIFDHHDLSPELFALRYDPKRKSLIHSALLWLERCTFKTADVVIATNESYKSVAVSRGKKDPDTVFVVRNGPNLDRFEPVPANPSLRNGRDYLVCYVGVMADQDGLDYLLRAIGGVVNERGRTDITFALIGSGDSVGSLKALALELGISDYVVFPGRISDADLIEHLSTADVCVVPDPYNDFNDKCTFIKIAEYMAVGKPIVSFDLTESRFTAGDAAVYVENNDAEQFGRKIIELIDDPGRRAAMGKFGIRRVREVLAWEHSKRHLLNAYEKALAG